MLARDFNALGVETLDTHWHTATTQTSNCVSWAIEQKIVTMNDVAKPFINFADMRTVADTR